MKLACHQINTQKKNRQSRRPKHKNCRNCGSTNLISVGVDQFCCACDWHTAFEYVDKGYMNNLNFAYHEHFSQKKKPNQKIIDLPKGNSPIVQSPETKTNKKTA